MGSRTLILVRHGQYFTDDTHAKYGSLTPLGKRQSVSLARRLRTYAPDALHVSTATRALETAAAVAKRTPEIPQRRSSLLLEGTPTVLSHMGRADRAEVRRHRARMERAFERHFRPTRGGDRVEAFVCHGNLIRFLLRLALGDHPDKWWRFDIVHCSISIVVVQPQGTKVVSYNDVGHLPPAMQTMT